MKARVTKKLKGTIVLGSVTHKSMVASQEFELSEEQYWADDVQSALRKGWITCADAPKLPKTVTVTNISLGSVSVPGIGVLSSGKSAELPLKFSDSLDVERLVKSKKVALGNRKHKLPEEPEVKFVVHKPKPAPETEPSEPVKKKAKAQKGKIKPVRDESDDLLIDTSAPAIDGSDQKEDKDSIVWVDHEETQRRIDSHPALRNKAKK